MQNRTTVQSIFVGSGRLDSASHACPESTLPAEPSPQPNLYLFTQFLNYSLESLLKTQLAKYHKMELFQASHYFYIDCIILSTTDILIIVRLSRKIHFFMVWVLNFSSHHIFVVFNIISFNVYF